MATVLEITARHERGGSPCLAHFDLAEAAEIDSAMVLTDPTLSPFCVDGASARLYFARLPSAIRLEEVAFIYVEQWMHATELVGVPFRELPGLARQVEPPAREIFAFNSARCGSTLLHRVLNSVAGTVSLAEYDVFGSVRALRASGFGHGETIELLSNCLAFCARDFPGQIVAHKFRHDTVAMAELFREARPSGRNLYLYRNAVDWSASWLRINSEFEENVDLGVVREHFLHLSEDVRAHFLPTLVEPEQATVPMIVATLMMWVDSVTGYLDAHEQSVPFLTVDYDDLDARPEATLARIFEYVGISARPGPETLAVLQTDSQAGTAMARADGRPNATKLAPEQVDMITRALQAHPRGLSPYMALPVAVSP